MRLRDTYYRVWSAHYGSDTPLFHVELLPGCDVYRGHFPGHPVCPGVCNIGMLKECMEEAVGVKLAIETIKQCRMTAVASPEICSELDIRMHIQSLGEARWAVQAKLYDAERTYMEYKGEMKQEDGGASEP